MSGWRQEAPFPIYTRPEMRADLVAHGVGVPGGLAASAWLVVHAAQRGGARQVAAAAVYGLGLVAMLWASAAYNLTPVGRRKAVLRHLDHAMIFVMIAGSYTPFALCALYPMPGIALLIAAWTVAVLGIVLKLIVGHRPRRGFTLLYLAHGWMLLPVLPPLIEAVPGRVLALLVAGGMVYSLGAVVYTRNGWRYHNAIWHALVLVAAALQFGAIEQVVGRG